MRARPLLVVLVIACASGCQLLAQEVPCVADSNCPASETCTAGVCVSRASDPTDAGARDGGPDPAPDAGARDGGPGPVDGGDSPADGGVVDAGADGGTDAGTDQDAGVVVPPPLARYSFDEGAGATVADTSGVVPALDLTIEDTANVTWGQGTLTVLQPGTLIRSGAAASKITESCLQTDEVTMDAWVTPEGTAAEGPARIVTISQGAARTHVSLNQSASVWNARIETEGHSSNLYWSENTTTTVSSGQLTHLLMTHTTAGGTRVYVDGALDSTFGVGEDLSVWTEAYELALANELPESNGTPVQRVWLGTFHEVAVWCTAFDDAQVAARFAQGASLP